MRGDIVNLDPNDYELREEYDLSYMTVVSKGPLGSQPLDKKNSVKRPVSVTGGSDASLIRSNCVLIVTVTKVETQAVLHAIPQATGADWKRQAIRNKTYYSLGTISGASAFLVQSEMGIATPGGALQTVRQAIQDLHPQAVIMCGIGFGLRPDKQELGDILIAKQIAYYESQKIDIEHGVFPRGDRVTASDLMVDRFRSADNDWTGAPTHFGLVVSGEKLVNDPQFRQRLLEVEPEALGGEMEGAGLYVAARHEKTDWILVKAICDWADGRKNDDAQQVAAKNAAEFVLHVLNIGGWESDAPDVAPAANASFMLKVEYQEQRRLLERLSIHQANLGELLSQKARLGIRIPLDLINDIKLQENEIENIDEQLKVVNEDIAKIEQGITETNLPRSVGIENQVGAVLDKFYIDLDNERYLVDIPYPAIGTESVLISDAQQHRLLFAGGFEIRTKVRQNVPGLNIEWYRHGRLVSPILDRESKRLILPLGRHVQVGQQETILWTKEDVGIMGESSVNRLDEDGWKIVPPAGLGEITTWMETPQGNESYILTTRIAFEGPWEVWTVTSKDGPVRTWFYFGDWSIAPLVDNENRTLAFPPLGNLSTSATI